MYVIGTAGHVDHGKSTLIKALTGINPDRLAEEQERQMTIDLGFAWYILPSGEEIGIVDVPGHRDFIDNMLAGVGGIDLVLFVVAADEGIMPQSREHLNIVKLLGIEHGLIVLTKIDLAPDADWLSLVEADIRELAADSFLEDAPIIKTSAITGDGLADLSTALDDALLKIRRKETISSPRLPIDRVFSLRGFGTIITGTLIGGSFSIGDEVVIQPSGIQTRIRGIQTHKKKQQTAMPGNRTAINLTGVEVRDILRGEALCKPGEFLPTKILDIEAEVLRDYPDALRHDEEVKVFVGTDQKIARVRVLGQDEILPGQSGFAQLMLVGNMVAAVGDRLILRRPSPAATIGGGTVINASPRKRHKRFSKEVLKRLAIHAGGSDEERILACIAEMQIAEFPDIKNHVEIPEDDLRTLLEDLADSGQIIPLSGLMDKEKPLYIAGSEWDRIEDAVRKGLTKFHRNNPLKFGADHAHVQNLIGVPKRFQKLLTVELIKKGVIEEKNQLLHLPEFSISLTENQKKQIAQIVQQFKAAGYQTPSAKEVIDYLGEDLYQYLLNKGDLLALGESVVYLPEQIDTVVSRTQAFLSEQEKFTVSDFRDYLETSRKYAVAILEYMDKLKITRRDGDFRIKYAG